MRNTLTILLSVLFSVSLMAQDVQRKLIKGTIVAPNSDDIEGVHIYNVSLHEGIVTDSNGAFEIEMAENDKLQITSLQYVSFSLVVQKEIIDRGEVVIYLNPVINQLDEVVLKTYNLTGNITVDVEKIKTVSNFKDFDLSYKTIEFEYEFAPDASSSIDANAAKEAYYSGQYREGANLIGGVNLLTRLIFANPIMPASSNEEMKYTIKSYRKLSEKFENEFITVHYDIPSDKVADFVYFVHESDFDPSLLEPENELLLLNYMVEKSEEYLANIKK